MLSRTVVAMTTVLLGFAGLFAGVLGVRLVRRWDVRPLWAAPAVGVLWAVAWSVDAPLSSYVLAWFGVLLVAIDLAHHRLPDALTLPLYPVLAFTEFQRLGEAALAAALFGGAHLAVRWWRPRVMGGGDVKLAGSLGAVLALPMLLPAAMLASTGTLLLAAVRRARRVPHGPGLMAATWALSTL